MASWYDDRELEEMIRGPESDLLERKRSAGDRSSIRRTLCAFANDLPDHGRPGILVIGMEDDGRCSGQTIDDALLRLLGQMRDDGNILPIPSLRVERKTVDGCEVAVIQVQPSTAPPVRYQGRVWVRVGPTTRQATPEEEARLSERRRSFDRPFDMRPVSEATMDDLDLRYAVMEYIPRAIAPDVLEENSRPVERQLASLRLVVGGHPTWGGLLALGHDPQSWLPGAWVQFARYAGGDVTAPIRNQKALTGRLEDILRRIDELLEANIEVRSDVTAGPREVRLPDYPLVALQQYVRNAIMHRTYEGTNTPVRVYWFDDRIEITSPGGLYGRVNPANFGSGETDYRNPLIAEVMHHLGFAQRFGMGIPLARKALAENGNPEPEFRFEPTLVAVTVRVAP